MKSSRASKESKAASPPVWDSEDQRAANTLAAMLIARNASNQVLASRQERDQDEATCEPGRHDAPTFVPRDCLVPVYAVSDGDAAPSKTLGKAQEPGSGSQADEESNNSQHTMSTGSSSPDHAKLPDKPRIKSGIEHVITENEKVFTSQVLDNNEQFAQHFSTRFESLCLDCGAPSAWSDQLARISCKCPLARGWEKPHYHRDDKAML